MRSSVSGRRPTNIHSANSSLEKTIKFHSGPIDQRSLSSLPSAVLKSKIVAVLTSMGLDITQNSDIFKLDVVKHPTSTLSSGVASIKNKKRRRKFGYAVTSFPLAMIEKIRYVGIFGLQYNRGFDGSAGIHAPPQHAAAAVEEDIAFTVSIRRIKNLDGLYTVNLRRVRGNIWEFKTLYGEIITLLQETN